MAMTLEKSSDPLERTQGVESKRSLVKKLAEVMGGMERIPKSGYNDFHKYRFVLESDVLDAVRKALAERHVILITSITGREFYPATPPEKQHKTVLAVKFVFIDGESGERLEFGGFGEANDGQDKGVNKAITAALKYGLLKFFLMSTGDDPDQHEGQRLDSTPPTRQSGMDGAPRPKPAAPPPGPVRPPAPPPPARPPEPPRTPAPPANPEWSAPVGTPAPLPPQPTGAIVESAQRVWSEAWEVATAPGKQKVSDFLKARGYTTRPDFFSRGADDYHETLKTLHSHDRARAGGG